MPRAVAGLRARHPDVDVELTEAEPPEALALLSAGDADLALVFSYDGEAPTEVRGWSGDRWRTSRSRWCSPPTTLRPHGAG